MASGLLLVLPLRFGLRRDRLAIGDLHRLDLDVDAVLAVQALARDLKVGVAHPRKHRLVRLVLPPDRKRAVFFLQAVQPGHELVLIALGPRFHGYRQERSWRGRALGNDRHVLWRERVARLHVGEFGHGDDVTGLGLSDRDRLFAPQHLE